MTAERVLDAFATKSADGATPIGMFVACQDPAFTEILGRSGYDFVVLDTEHSPMGPPEILRHVLAAELTGMLPIVRVWDNSRALIQKFLDVGAKGIVVPHVDTADDAAAAVAATRFPPRGSRSMCPANHSWGYSMDRWYEQAAESVDQDDVAVIPIIESQTAVDNIDEILAVDGINLVLFGPGDYSQSVGAPMDSARVRDAWERVLSSANRAGKRVVTTDNVPGLEAGQAAAVIHGMDLLHVNAWVVDAVAALRSRLSFQLNSTARG